MDRAMLLDHLALADRHISEGEGHLARQRGIVERLQRDGLDSSLAESVLRQLESTQGLHLADRRRLLTELAESS